MECLSFPVTSSIPEISRGSPGFDGLQQRRSCPTRLSEIATDAIPTCYRRDTASVF